MVAENSSVQDVLNWLPKHYFRRNRPTKWAGFSCKWT